MDCIELDGSQGEGGGQILRTALTLSMITGIPFRIAKIRARRQKPGLLRQHLTAVRAAAEICGAQLTGAEPGSLNLEFVPGKIRGGDYEFSIGTAGSCTLVLQTVLPALWFADVPSTVLVSGGTHNSMAPPSDFLIEAWLPLMRRMGVTMQLALLRHGFYPAGGGQLRATVEPSATLQALELLERGELREVRAVSIVAGVPANVAKRELGVVAAELADLGPAFVGMESDLRGLPSSEGPGNALLLALAYEHLTEVFTTFGEKGVAAERVAQRLVTEARAYCAETAAVAEHLADQLVLPMALAGAGTFTTTLLSSHLTTNCEVIAKFLPVEFAIESAPGRHTIRVT